MASRTVVHVGLPKTGTTYLQTIMWRQGDLLREQGVLYPGDSRMHHFQAARAVAGVPGKHGYAEQQRAALVEEVRAWDGTALVTHEFFSQATSAQAARFVETLSPTDLTVVVTARDYLRQVPAVWQEALKMGNASTLGAFTAAMFADGHRERVRRAHEDDDVADKRLRRAWDWSTQDLPAVLQRWSRAVGPERMRLVTVPPPGAPRDLLWQRWCEAAGLDLDGVDLTVAVPNESLGAPQARFLTSVVDQLGKDFGNAPTRHRWLRQYLGHEVLVPQRGERIGLAPDDDALVRRTNAEMLDEVRALGLPVVGDLADLEPAGDAAGRDPDSVPDAEALAVAARAAERMVTDVRRLTETAQGRPPEPVPAVPEPSRTGLLRRLGLRQGPRQGPR